VPTTAPARPALSTRAPRVYRLFSLSGVLPLGAFLVVHLAINAAALRGDATFARAVHVVRRLPALWLFESALVFAPLVFHAGVGLWMVVTRTPLAESSPYPRALRVAVRATGVVAVAFVAMHLPELRWRAPGARLGAGELETLLAADLSTVWFGVPWRGAAYLVGTACVTFHFAAGAWGWLVTTALGDRSRARRWAGWGAGAVGALLWVTLANVVVFHATGSRLFGEPAEEMNDGDAARGACPAGEASSK
jgi:succinate dehydrogenase / fumarate reductase, cytochrome b subunit